jgi:hypothetical protein
MAGAGASIVWGGVAAAAITAVAAVASALISRKLKISEFRQAWIDALREEIAKYLTAIDTTRYRFGMTERPGSTAKDLDNLEDARNAAMLAYRRIVLRLNITEPPHVKLTQELQRLMLIKSKTPDVSQMERVITQARDVLRYEWAVTKYGLFARPILMCKSWFKRLL